MAIIYFLNTLLAFFNIDLYIFSMLSGISLLPLCFMYLCSYVFKFCFYHRMFLHYILINDVLCWIDYLFNVNVSTNNILNIHMIITAICLIIILYSYVKSHKTRITENS